MYRPLRSMTCAGTEIKLVLTRTTSSSPTSDALSLGVEVCFCSKARGEPLAGRKTGGPVWALVLGAKTQNKVSTERLNVIVFIITVSKPAENSPFRIQQFQCCV